MHFEEAHELFIHHHMASREGERKSRLSEGHGHAEKLLLKNVWWPLFGNFDYLHPEYHIFDLKHGSRFIDFAYIHPHFRAAVEVDGFGPHIRQMSRWKFADQLNRQNYLVAMGWHVLRFSYDEVQDQPENCRHMLQLLMGKFLGEERVTSKADLLQKELIRLAVRLVRPITPKDAADHFQMDVRTARNLLHQMVEKGWMKPSGTTRRIRKYELNRKVELGLL